jgi:SOS-response transcriptional repressor LexA
VRIDNMKELKDRVKERREELGLSQKGLAKLCFVTQQTIQKIEIGEIKHPRNMQKLAAALKSTPAELLYGTESLQPPSSADNVSTLQGNSQGVNPIGLGRIPIIDWNQLLIHKDGGLIMDEKTEYIYTRNTSLTNCVALEISNDEMATKNPKETFNPGEYIIVDLKRKYELNDFVVARMKSSNKLIFKQYIEYAGKHYLKSLNSQYPIIEITDDIKIIGVVVSVHNERILKR